MNGSIFNKLFKQGVLGLCVSDVLDLPIAEKVKFESSLAAHIVPLAPTGVCLYCPCIKAKEFFKKLTIQPICRKWQKLVESDILKNHFLPPTATPWLLFVELGMHLGPHGYCSHPGSQFHWSSLLSATPRSWNAQFPKSGQIESPICRKWHKTCRKWHGSLPIMHNIILMVVHMGQD